MESRSTALAIFSGLAIKAAEREIKNFNTRIKELDLERPIDDRLR
jgi:hypothetical protein